MCFLRATILRNEPEPFGNPQDVRIHRKNLSAAGEGKHHRGSFDADAFVLTQQC